MKIAEDRQALLFETQEGNLVVNADGDCCSYTWIEHVELPALGFPAFVLAVEELELPEDQEKPSDFHRDSDVLALYGCKITTDRGEIVIDFRNDSNGYYGGDLAWNKEWFYGGVHRQNVSKEVWVELK